MRLLLRRKHIPVFGLLFCVCLAFLALAGRAAADHTTPERVVENTYTVILLMVPEGGDMHFRLLFRYVQSGKNVTVPIVYRVSVGEEDSRGNVLATKEGETNNGIAEFLHAFPMGGLYDISLEFEKADEPGKVYRPDKWTLWVPGATASFFQRYPVGFTEIAGFLAFLGASAVVIGSMWFKRARGEAPDLSFFGMFGSAESRNRRMAIMRRERKKYSLKSPQ